MDSLIEEFKELRLSALSKAKVLNSSIHEITIGPESTKTNESFVQQELSNLKNVEPEELRKSHEPPTQSIIYKTISNHYELDRLAKVQEAANDRKKKFISFSQQIQNESNKQWIARQKALSEQMKLQEVEITKRLEEFSKERNNQDQVDRYYQQLAEVRKQKERELLENEMKAKIIDEIKKCEVDCQKIYEKIIPLLSSCKKEVLEEHTSQLNSIPAEMSKICSECAKGIINKEELTKAKEIVKKLFHIYEKIKEAVNKQAEVGKPYIKAVRPSKTTPVVTDKYVSETSFKSYEAFQKLLEQTQKDYSILESDDSLKQFRFDCKKAINIPVNAISSASGRHLLDKYVKLYDLLSGKNVQISDTMINASRHNQGIKYCTDLLAQKFVLQGDLMISSNPEAAFCYATIILSLWNDFPLFGDLLLGRFYKQCPYLLPMYIVKTQNQTDEDFYRLQGYQYGSDGVIEKQDKYLKRLTGLMRLFTAMMVAKPKSSQQPKTPFGMADAWQWLSSILNLPPKPDVTATLMHVFFQNVGVEMCKTYKIQFLKLMLYINESYMPLLKKIDTGGPVSRLEGLLKEFNEKGIFEPPQGILSNNFW